MTGAESYYDAITDADDHLQDGLENLQAREAAGTVTVREAAGERVRLLEEHLAACRDLVRRYLGGGS